MPINFASAKPGIEMFNANVARGNTERHAQGQEDRAFEDQAMRRTLQQQAQGADAGVRNAIAAFYANKNPAAAPVPTTTFQPTPVASPLPVAPVMPAAGPAGAPASNGMDFGNEAPSAPAAPVAAQPAGGPAVWMPNGGSAGPIAPSSFALRNVRGGQEIPIPNATDMGNDPRLPTAQAAPAPVQAAPAAPAGAPAPAARAPAGGSTGGMSSLMGDLAKTPGTGATMMSLFGTDRQSERTAGIERQKLHMDGIKLFADASKNNDIATMRAVSQRYDLGIPPEALNRREIMAGIASAVNNAKTLGITDDAKAIAFAKGYMHAESRGMDPRAAAIAGFDEAQKVEAPFKATHWAPSPTGDQLAFDATGASKNTGVKIREPRAAGDGTGSGRPSATIQNRDDMARRLKVAHPGLDEATIQGMVVNPRGQVTTETIIRVANNLRKATKMGLPLYKTEEEVQKAALETVNAARRDAASMLRSVDREDDPDAALNRQFGAPGAGGAPAPAGAPAAGGAAAPAGEVIDYDANGRRVKK